MAASIGDIVATLGVDADPWVRNMSRAIESNRSFTDSAQNIANVGRGLLNIADTASKGSGSLFELARAGTGVVQAIGPFLGPKGRAAAAIADIADVGLTVAQQFMAAKNAGEDLVATIDRISAATSKITAKDTRAFAFVNQLENLPLDNPDAWKSATNANDLELTQARNARDQLTKARRASIEEAIRGGLVENIKGWHSPDSSGPGIERFFDKTGNFIGGLKFVDDEALRKVNEMLEQIKELDDSVARLTNRGEALKKGMQDAFDNRRTKEQVARDKAEQQHFEDLARSPLDIAQFDLGRLGNAAANGGWGPDLIEKAGRQIIRTFASTQGPRTGALQLADVSSSAGVAAVQAALRQQGNTPEIELLRQQLDTLKEIARRSGNERPPVTVVQQGIN